MLASPLKVQSLEDCESSRIPIAPEKPAALFSSRSKEPGNQFKRSVFKNADPPNFGRSLLEATKDHLHRQARSETMMQEDQVETLYLHQRVSATNFLLKDLNYRTHKTDLLKLDENRLCTKVSVQKLRISNHETRQKLTSQLQEMQEQNNSLNSGELQEMESDCNGELSYVSSQPAMTPSSRSMLSRDKRLPPDTWNTSVLQENVFGSQFSTFDSLRDHPQGMQFRKTQIEQGSIPQAAGSRTLFARDDKQK